MRKKLIEVLRDNPMTVPQLARVMRASPRDVAEDLEHLLKSLKHTEYVLEVAPARCRKCGFEFGEDKLRKPSRCPECKGTWLSEPRLLIREGSRGTP